MKRFFALFLVAVMLLSAAPVSSMAASQYAMVVGGWLRLRSDPNFGAYTIASYYTGTQVQVLEKKDDWYKVTTPDGLNGYMYGQYLSFSTVPPTGTDVTQNQAVVTSHNGYGVRLRTGPGTGYRIIRTYPVGTVATLLQRGCYWSKISINGVTGYMMNQFLIFGGMCAPDQGSGTPNPAPTFVGSATIWSRNGYGVRLRTGPSKSNGIIGVYSVGTQVNIIEHGPIWSKIQVGSRVGYMMTEFLYITLSNRVTEVKLNITNPVCGDTLEIVSIKPSDAKVNIVWLMGDKEVAKDTKQLKLNSLDFADKVITVRVTGTAGYTGTAVANTLPVRNVKLELLGVELDNATPVVGNKLGIKSVNPVGATYTCEWHVGGMRLDTKEAVLEVIDAYAGKEIELRVSGTGNFSGSATATVKVAPAETKKEAHISKVEISNTTPKLDETLSVKVTLSTGEVADDKDYTCEWFAVDTAGTVSDPISNENTLEVGYGYDNHKLLVRVTGKGEYQSDKAEAITEMIVLSASGNSTASGNSAAGTTVKTDPSASGNSSAGTAEQTDPSASGNSSVGTAEKTDPSASGNSSAGTAEKTDPSIGGNVNANTPGKNDPSASGNVNANTDGKNDPSIGGNINANTDGKTDPSIGGNINANTDGKTDPSIGGNVNANTDGKNEPSIGGNVNANTDGKNEPSIGGNVNANTDGKNEPSIGGNVNANTDGNKETGADGNSDANADGNKETGVDGNSNGGNAGNNELDTSGNSDGGSAEKNDASIDGNSDSEVKVETVVSDNTPTAGSGSQETKPANVSYMVALTQNGNQLDVMITPKPPQGTATYRWFCANTEKQEITGESYDLTEGDHGSTFKVEVIVSEKSFYSNELTVQ